MRRRNSADETGDPGCVLPGKLFLGSAIGAEDEARLRLLGVRRIVNTAVEVPCFHRDKGHFEYRHLRYEDDADEQLMLKDEALLEFIDGDVTLVHCQAGISRSVTFVVAYLMQRKQMSLKDAFLAVKSARPQAGPNSGYWKQLMQLEESLTGSQCTFNLKDYYFTTLLDMGFQREQIFRCMEGLPDDAPRFFDLVLGKLLLT
jgi:hypothetical protein